MARNLSLLILMSSDSGMSGTTRSMSRHTPKTMCWKNRSYELKEHLTLNFPSHLEDDDEGQLEREDLPVHGREGAVVIPEGPVAALGLVLVQPALVGRGGQGEVDVALHVPVVLVLVHQFRDELGGEGDQEGLGTRQSLDNQEKKRVKIVFVYLLPKNTQRKSRSY